MKIALILAEKLSPLESAVCAPLSILMLAAVAEKRGHRARIVNMRAHRSHAEIQKQLEDIVQWKPDLIGLSAVTIYSTIFAMAARFFRKRCPGVLLIGGGPHPTSDNREVLMQNLVDICVHNEGERTFELLLEALENGADPHLVTGISYRRGEEIAENPPTPFIEDLDSLPLPAWRLLDFAAYRRHSGMADFYRWSATLFTSRGCPYHCIYCHNIFGHRFRARSPQNVFSEIELLHDRFGMRSFEFIDDIFNLDKPRAMEILAGFGERFHDAGIAFPNGLRGDLLDEDLIRLMKKANCWHTSIAIETSSPRMQREIRKNIDMEKLKNALRLLKKYDIFTRGFIMIGFPNETLDEVRETLRFALEQPLNYALIFIVSPFNKTELQQRLDPELHKKFLSRTDHIDYRLGDDSIGDIPYEVLEKLRSRYYRLGMLRWRNRKLWLSMVRGLMSNGAIKRVALLLAMFAGVGNQPINKRSIQIRQSEYALLDKRLNGG